MRVVHLSAYDAVGGAARSAYRLHGALRKEGVESVMVVRTARREDPTVLSPSSALARGYALVRAYADAAAPRLLYRRKAPGNFGGALLPERMRRTLAGAGPDLVHVHWIGEGFVRPETLRRLARPLVWTLHDAWAFTGGCHLPGACRRFADACGRCPVLASERERDLSRRVWRRKRRAWGELDPVVVAPSRWMAERARSSSLLSSRRVEIIPNGVDTALFHPVPREVARELLGLPAQGELVLFAALAPSSDPNKGLRGLVEALGVVARSRPGLRLLAAGASGGIDAGPVPVHHLGPLGDEVSMVLAHCASDLVVIPSQEENLPNVALEALACGRPVAAFAVGGIPEIVQDRKTGALARPHDASDLAGAIGWILEDRSRWGELSAEARRIAVAEYGAQHVARRHAALYADILAAHTAKRAGP